MAWAAPARAQSPTGGAPKILLAFDASGSMAADDGAGTPKIKAAQDAAVSLLGSLPPSTQVGLRVFGGTKPSRPIGPACRDSSLVLPIGPLTRTQAEAQIRSFKAKGRTPIAYALERAAEDLGTTGSRTIILVSDGKDTCQPPSPCEVAKRIARNGVEMRIQAIGFNVDPSSKRELQCIANAGGGVYADADNADALRQQLQALSTRALRQYVPRGKPVRGGPNARNATALVPGRYVDAMLPDSERWYAVDLRRGETLEASASFIPPKREVAEAGRLAESSLDIVTPSFDIPDRQNSSATGEPFQRRGFVDGLGVVSRPIGVGAQAASDMPFSQPGRYYLKLALKDSDDKALFNVTGGQPYPAELAVTVLGRHGGNPSPSKGPKPTGPNPSQAAVATPNEPPATALLILVGAGLAALGFVAGGAALRARRRR
ncbi:MAG TPA: VWA domain-containing protein [Solirubrobacteraceae bacterium]